MPRLHRTGAISSWPARRCKRTGPSCARNRIWKHDDPGRAGTGRHPPARDLLPGLPDGRSHTQTLEDDYRRREEAAISKRTAIYTTAVEHCRPSQTGATWSQCCRPN